MINCKPILFSTTMVQAILANRKTATRRPIKPKYSDSIFEMKYGKLFECEPPTPLVYNPETKTTTFKVRRFVEVKPKYQVGDIMYVRETWTPETEQGCKTGAYIYKATDAPEPDGDYPLKWRPSIHMPKEAARIFQKITGMRAEKLHDITEEQSIAEGIRIGMTSNYSAYFSCRDAFRFLWDSIYDSQGYGWDVNPWVWVYEFEATEKE